MLQLEDDDLVNFGPLPAEVNRLLQRGVSLYLDDPVGAELAFREALALDPEALPAWFCLVKLHNRHRQFDAALEAALGALAEASRQCGLPADWSTWTAAQFPSRIETPWSHLLRALKAVAFLELRHGHRAPAEAIVAQLRCLDPEDGVGYSVIESLLEATA